MTRLLWLALALLVLFVLASPGISQVSTTQVNTELPNASTTTDAAPNPTVPGVRSYQYIINGTTWDRMTTGDKVEDAVVAGAEVGPVPLTRRIDVAASSAGTSGDYAMQNTDALGLLWARFLDPCSGVAKVVYVVDIVTAATTELINGAGAANNVYICGVFLGPTGGATNVTLVEDDTDNCASPTAGMFGGVTAAEGWNMAANGGTNIGTGAATVSKTTALNRFVCLISSAATQVSGTIVYALAP